MPRGSTKSPQRFYEEKFLQPYLATLSSELQRRFSDRNRSVFLLRSLIPFYTDREQLDGCIDVLDKYRTYHKV